MIYAITGATGNIGSRIASILISKGKKVRVIGRSKDKLKYFINQGAEAAVANLENSSETVNALKGAKAIFAMIPPNYSAEDMRGYQNSVGASLAQGITDSGATHVVNLSSFGAHLGQGTGPILGLHDQEKRLNKITGINIIHLRPASFMENLLMNINLIRHNGIMGSPLKSSTLNPMIATKDIAAIAAELLDGLDFSGVTTRELLGPKEYTMEEVTKIFAKAIGKKDLKYVEFPYAEALKGMVEMGLSQDSASLMVDLNKSINEGLLKPEEKRSTRNTTATALEDFAQVFADIYSQASEAAPSN